MFTTETNLNEIINETEEVDQTQYPYILKENHFLSGTARGFFEDYSKAEKLKKIHNQCVKLFGNIKNQKVALQMLNENLQNHSKFYLFHFKRFTE
jgi:hypothetical protein